MNADLIRVHERIDALEAMIMDVRKQLGDQMLLAERNRELRRALGAREMVFPKSWGLYRQESLFLSSLMAAPNGYRSFDQLAAALFVGEIAPSMQGIRVVASRIRSKLVHLNIVIENDKGSGYRLSRETRARLESAMASPPEH